MIKYDPWAESHAPKNFERTDPTRRYSPIVVSESDFTDELGSNILVIIACVVAGGIGAIVLYLWCTV